MFLVEPRGFRQPILFVPWQLSSCHRKGAFHVTLEDFARCGVLLLVLNLA
jgi:hypothetical protein